MLTQQLYVKFVEDGSHKLKMHQKKTIGLLVNYSRR